MRFARRMPSVSSSRTCSGNSSPAACALSAGISDSSTIVVLPEPETPVTATSRPRGISTSSGLTVCNWLVVMRIRPRSNTCGSATRSRMRALTLSAKNGAIRLLGFAATSSTVPCAITCPPSAPATGPISMRWPAALSTRTSWSTTTTELPSATRSRITPSSPSTFEGCSPMDGSSSTYSTPVVRLRTARASCTRWRSPVESVAPARSSAR